jgi:hypothetical protein
MKSFLQYLHEDLKADIAARNARKKEQGELLWNEDPANAKNRVPWSQDPANAANRVPWSEDPANARNRDKVLEEAKTAAWTRSEGKDPEGGLNKKGVASYRRENPGSKLQTAVTEDPKKLKKGSKKAKRSKSFCSRMCGMKKRLTSKKTASNPDSRINKALRKWNCKCG